MSRKLTDQKRTVATQRAMERRLKELTEVAQQKSIALRQVLSHIAEEKAEVSRMVKENVDMIIMPMIDSLQRSLPAQHCGSLQALREAAEEVASPFVSRISNALAPLTPSELRICSLIRQGLGSKEIARFQHISPHTVRTHRFQIRRKLGLLNKKTNLVSFLRTIEKPQRP